MGIFSPLTVVDVDHGVDWRVKGELDLILCSGMQIPLCAVLAYAPLLVCEREQTQSVPFNSTEGTEHHR